MKFLSTTAPKTLAIVINLLVSGIGVTTAPHMAIAQEMKMPRTISINGHGEISVVPNLASVSIGVTSNGKTANEALAQNTKAMQQVFAALKTAGIADTDIQTSNFSVNPRLIYPQDGSNKPPVVDGYDVNNQVTVIVRKLDMLGGLLDQMVNAGSNQINGINFTVDNADKILDSARTQAVADARRKAEIYAQAAGVKLGRVISISEGAAYQPPPVMYSRAKADMAGAPAPIAQGEQTLSMDVSLVWELE
jgi:uncharacterized protein